MIAVLNKSTRFSTADTKTAVAAVAHQLRYHAAPHWGMTSVPVVFYSQDTDVPKGAYVIGIYDNSDQPGALGYHTEEGDGTVDGRVFAGPVLDNGGTALSGALTVASVLSHEVLEAFVDPQVNRWAQAPDGSLFAVEVGDPVESWSYNIFVNQVPVSVSDFVFPAWFDDNAPAGSRTHYQSQPLASFTLGHGGYAIKMSGGSESAVYGAEYPAWKLDGKLSPAARSAKRQKVSSTA